MVNRFPIFKGAVYAKSVAQGGYYFDSDVVPTEEPTTFIIHYAKVVGTNNSALPSVSRKHEGTEVFELMPGSLSAGNGPSVFQIIVAPGDTINLKNDGANGTDIATVIVLEVETASGSYNFPTRLS